ncbi:MAG: sodium:proton antiporter [Planctomycetaceae bacterium]|nr:sodium:proton antiporter [Planctomycetaceae bacterium]
MSRNEHHRQENCCEKKADSSIRVIFAILALFMLYGVLLSRGLPQQWTKNVSAPQMVAAVERADAKPTPPPVWMITPFVTLLLCIAVLPLVPATSHWWEHNSSKFLVAASLGILTLAYYFLMHRHPVLQHWPVPHTMVGPTEGLGGETEVCCNFEIARTVFMNAVINDFIPFIVLLFALYTITGGIRIEGNFRATPLTNTIILAVGAVLASFIGTTGAAMILIRLLLEVNKERKIKAHTVVFFIFIVCNCGGVLTPLGDPPLFLGYLSGVKFWFTARLFVEWAFVNGLLLVVYFSWDTVAGMGGSLRPRADALRCRACHTSFRDFQPASVDTFFAYSRETKENLAKDDTERQPFHVSGLMPNLFLLTGVVLSVMFLAPSMPVFGWHPWFFFREIVMLGLIFLSLTLGNRSVRVANGFNYSAIIEVAVLFFGIFLCMPPPLQILAVDGPNLGVVEPVHFFWATGALSSFLDNAPTYLVFFETAKTLLPASEHAAAIAATGVPLDAARLSAVSLGAVFMGAMTYIGNGPNFMVKAIAEQSGVKMPGFFGYMVYSCLILLPILAAMTLIFLV